MPYLLPTALLSTILPWIIRFSWERRAAETFVISGMNTCKLCWLTMKMSSIGWRLVRIQMKGFRKICRCSFPTRHLQSKFWGHQSMSNRLPKRLNRNPLGARIAPQPPPPPHTHNFGLKFLAILTKNFSLYLVNRCQYKYPYLAISIKLAFLCADPMTMTQVSINMRPQICFNHRKSI